MPTAVEQQQQQGPSPGECDTIGKGVFSKIIDAMPASPEQKDEHDLAGLTTNLDLKDHETEPIPIAKPTTTKPGHDETASKATNENFDPKLAHATTAPQPECEPIEVTGIDRTALATVSNDSFTLTSHIAATKSELGPDHDETSSPGLGTYIRLHNDMMTSKTALSSHATERVQNYHRASHIARTLLTSHENHDDLPLVIHAHACLVLGCSDEDDCYERMEEALRLVKTAVEEGALVEQEGREMMETCEAVMGMRKRVGNEDENDEESDDDDDSDPDASDGCESVGRNDALP